MIAFTYKNKVLGLLFILAAGWLTGCSDSDDAKPAPPPPPSTSSQVEFWLTNADKSVLFARQTASLNFKTTTNSNPTITIDTTTTYQSIDGFGYTLTGGSALVLSQMGASDRAKLLEELFKHDEANIGISYLRLNLGASDLSASVYSYNDRPAGQPDPELNYFNLDPDRLYYLPVLKEILAVNPNITLLATPWSPPAWMKTNNSPKGGSLKPEYYEAYAQYLVKYIQAMQQEGIIVDALTVQNEPLHDGNNPSMHMSAGEQANFIKNNIGPALRDAGLATKLIIYDHNADRPDYPISILNDLEAKQYIDGSAFHLYGGNIESLSQVKAAHPDKNIYFTEQYTGVGGDFGGDLGWHIRNLIVGATRNWSRNVLEWNLAANQSNGPYTNGGCNTCLPAVTIGNNVTRNVSYYIIAHAAKFVRPGSVRVGSNIIGSLQNVAFQTPDGKKVLIVLNDGSAAQTFNISHKGKVVTTALNAGSVGTYVW
ncbi:glycoside hydrolase family 30 beta sandwich domain-containing protein [Pontibacter korlensis]|uniref:Glucosylceramidase n=1 Tax=Pontibacter korlensis TaxID=400092 RepID=A0A0E3ZHV3_9BACT|nr:glycoside hydrolase family 30 beta sandwich domain-containing protein [Pontibacter korlensis]AKD05718.1 glucosylceramidase [Pontibacter korlensis]